MERLFDFVLIVSLFREIPTFIQDDKDEKLALAALVAGTAGAAFAQASLTGNVTYGYTQTTSAAGSLASGLGVDTAELYLGSKEDLGGGSTVEAKLGLADTTRAGVTGGDLSLVYTNMSVGQISMETEKGSDYFAGIASAGAPVINMDGKHHETRSSSDSIAYTVPVGPVYMRFSHGESSSGIGLGRGGAGSASNTVKQRNNTVSAYYASGPLQALLAFRSYDNRIEGDPLSLAAVGGVSDYLQATKNSIINAQASYDLGVAKVGAGFQESTGTNGITVRDALMGVSVPAGAFTFGATYSTSDLQGARDTHALVGWKASQYNGRATGYSLGVQYAMSKRTSLALKTANWTHSGYSQYEADAALGTNTAGAAGRGYDKTANETTLLLSHSF